MVNDTKCKIIIDSNSRFSPIGCPNCSATIWSTGMTEEETKAGLEYEEGNHFNDKPFFAYLPHDTISWNRFDADVVDGTIYYNGQPVVKLNDIQEFYGGIEINDGDDESEPEKEYELGPCEVKSELGDLKKYHHYYLFIENDNNANDTNTNLEDSEDGTKITSDNTNMKKMIWYFDGIPMTDCHIHILIPV